MLKKNLVLFRIYYFFWRFKPLATLMVIYFFHIMQSYTLAMAVFSVFNISYAIMKVPSGMISDKIGRKSVIITANLLLLTAFALLALAGEINARWLLFAFAIFWGISEALASGTLEALIFETSQSLGYEDKFYKIYSKSMVFDQAGCAFGAFWAMAVTYFLPLQVLAWLSVFPPLMQFILSMFFIEPKARKKNFCISFDDFVQTFKQFKNNKKLSFYALADIYFSTLGDISHRLESAYFKSFVSDWIISLARMIKHFFGMLGFAIVSYLKKFHNTEVYFSSITSNVSVRIIALIFNNAGTPFIHSIINFFYATALTAKEDILQHEFLPQYRAATQSVIQFIKGIYMAGLMFVLGFISDICGIYFVMCMLVVLRVLGLVAAYYVKKGITQKKCLTK